MFLSEDPPLAMAASGGEFTVVMAEDGVVRTFSDGVVGQLFSDGEVRQLWMLGSLHPARVGGREVIDALVVMVAAGFNPREK